MRSVWLGALVVVAACSSKPAEVPDAAVDADSCASTTLVFTPVTVTGTSPHGPLDAFHYAYAGFISGDCPDAYLIDLTPTEQEPVCSTAWLELAIYPPFAAGSNQASAALPIYSDGMTQNVTFEATRLDTPDAMPSSVEAKPAYRSGHA
jgi:hypothetical protein